MRVGIAFDVKEEPAGRKGRTPAAGAGPLPAAEPDDLQEEFDSPVTIEAIASVLRGLGHDVMQLGDGRELIQRVLADPPELVFNFAEGQGVGRAREARVPAFLEMLGIPYTGSDPLTLAATLDKDCAKRLAASAGVATPRGQVLSRLEDLEPGLPYPLILKPAWEGSSKGIRQACLLDRPEQLKELLPNLLRDYRQPILAEEFIQGEELTVGVIGNVSPEVIGIMHVVPLKATPRFIYSLEVKRAYKDQVRYDCDPKFPEAVLGAIRRAALACYRVLGCRDVARVDFRLKGGVPYFLEVNPLPGLHPENSDLVILARARGWSYEQLVSRIVSEALGRQPGSQLPCPARPVRAI